MNLLKTANIRDKISMIDRVCNEAFNGKLTEIPDLPSRDILVRSPEEHPAKKGLSYKEGQARLLHDLANIELQALELCTRTLMEFQQAPIQFREELAELAKSEARHLTLCLDGIESLGFKWGDWPAHTVLWQAVSREDSLIDRVLIVHRYLEGSGLDAGETILKRLNGVTEGIIHKAVGTIVSEEVGHVEFGTRWYRELCRQEKIDSQEDFGIRIQNLRYRLPRRIEKISRELRIKAGFSESEIQFLEDFRIKTAKLGVSNPIAIN